jgi:hypothetical protein
MILALVVFWVAPVPKYTQIGTLCSALSVTLQEIIRTLLPDVGVIIVWRVVLEEFIGRKIEMTTLAPGMPADVDN